LKPEWWGSPLDQGKKYQEEQACDKRQDDDDDNDTTTTTTYTPGTSIREEINGTGKYSQKHCVQIHPWVRQIQASVNGIRKELSALAEIKPDDRKTKNMKRNKLLTKHYSGKKENFNEVTEELKQKVISNDATLI
jgi:hypothetical protein